jgi:hypothetical protein
MAFPRELVEQHRGMIPRRVRVVAQSCGVRALNACTCEQERGRRVCEGPRARRTPPEGAFSPRARRTPPEGAFSPRARRTPPEGASIPRARQTRGGILLCRPSGPRGPPGSWSCRARVLGSWVSPRFAFFVSCKRVSPGYLGDPYRCPRHVTRPSEVVTHPQRPEGETTYRFQEDCEPDFLAIHCEWRGQMARGVTSLLFFLSFVLPPSQKECHCRNFRTNY